MPRWIGLVLSEAIGNQIFYRRYRKNPLSSIVYGEKLKPLSV